MRKPLFLTALCLLTGLMASAQARTNPDSMPDKVMGAEFRSLDAAAPIRLGGGKDKVIVLVFWATWCPPCVQVLDELNRLGKESAGLRVVGLTVDKEDSEESMRSFVRTYDIGFQLGWIDEEMFKAVAGDSSTIPQTFIITGRGEITRRLMGWNPNKTPNILLKALRLAGVRFKPQRGR